MERLAAMKTFNVALESWLFFEEEAAADEVCVLFADEEDVVPDVDDPHPQISTAAIAAQSSSDTNFFFM